MVYICGVDDVVFIDDGLDVVVLSCGLYWFDTLSIPTNNKTKARNIANNILSDRPSHYSEIVLKKVDGLYFVYCFERAMIEGLIKKHHLEGKKVFFLEELGIEVALRVDDTLSIFAFENKIIENKNPKNPEKMQTLSEYFVEHKIALRKPLIKLNVNRGSNIKLLVAINIVFALGIGVFSYNKYSTLEKIVALQEGLEYGGKSGYEIKSQLSGYLKQEKRSLALKTELKTITQNNKNITKLVYAKEKFTIEKGK